MEPPDIAPMNRVTKTQAVLNEVLRLNQDLEFADDMQMREDTNRSYARDYYRITPTADEVLCLISEHMTMEESNRLFQVGFNSIIDEGAYPGERVSDRLWTYDTHTFRELTEAGVILTIAYTSNKEGRKAAKSAKGLKRKEAPEDNATIDLT